MGSLTAYWQIMFTCSILNSFETIATVTVFEIADSVFACALGCDKWDDLARVDLPGFLARMNLVTNFI